MHLMNETNRTLESLAQLKRAPMPDVLRAKLGAMIPDALRPRVVMLHKPALLLAAAGLALLIGINAVTIIRRLRPAHASAQVIADQYFAPAPSI